MKKTIKLLTTAIICLLITSFTTTKTMPYFGTYGVSSSDPSHIKLVINADHSYSYQDFSASEDRIVVSGNWTQKGEKIVLDANKVVGKFHHVWTFEKNGQVAKSRKGLSFYRLSKISE